MKLFLASSFDETFNLLTTKVGSLVGKTVLFSANAADNHPGDKWWLKTDRDAFEKLGGKIQEVDLRAISSEELADQLEKADIFHFCGGSVIYLASLIKNKELVAPITNAVRQGKVIYTGTSAGSMLVSADLTMGTYDPEEEPYVKATKDYSGLGLVNFLIMPHADNQDFLESNRRTIEHLPENKVPLIFLNDNQAVWVEDGKLEILGKK